MKSEVIYYGIASLFCGNDTFMSFYINEFGGNMNSQRMVKQLFLALFLIVFVIGCDIVAASVVSQGDENENISDLQNTGMPYNLIPYIDYMEDMEPYKGVVYLTFDDGPGKLTSGLLDILQKENVPATFFVLGEQVEKYPHIIKRMVDEGHSIGNHTYNHAYAQLYGSFDQFADQVYKTTKLIYQLTGKFKPLFRAPGGSYQNIDQSYYEALEDAGYVLFDWNVDSGDSTRRGVTTEEIITNVKQAPLRKRVIVLLHDSNTHQATIEAMSDIIDYYRKQNYQFASLTAETIPMQAQISSITRWERESATRKEQKAFVNKIKKIKQSDGK